MSKENKQESSQFDKFIEDTLKREQAAKDKHKEWVESHEENPQLEYNKLYRERWQNRIKWKNND